MTFYEWMRAQSGVHGALLWYHPEALTKEVAQVLVNATL